MNLRMVDSNPGADRQGRVDHSKNRPFASHGWQRYLVAEGGQAGSVPSFEGRQFTDIACRAVDVVIAILALLFMAPLLLSLAVLIRSADGGDAIFSQPRIGRGGRPFRCLKLRTMAMDSEAKLAEHLAMNAMARQAWARDHKLRNDPRVTPIGGFLRKSSLDELPQLINVLMGQMSLVGPRPIVAAEIPRYGRSFSRYCSVRPGITGLWQISGRNDVSYRRRVALDVTYVQKRSLGVNLWIIAATLPAVVLRKGSY